MRNNSLQTDIADLLGAVSCETKPQDSVPTVLTPSATPVSASSSAPVSLVLVGELQPLPIINPRVAQCKPMFDRIVSGESVRSVLRDLTSITDFWQWLYADPELQAEYSKVLAARANVYAEELVDLCDDTTGDYVSDAEGNTRFNPENVLRSKLRVNTRQWVISKLLPKRYGERLEVAGDAASPLTIVLTAADDKL